MDDKRVNIECCATCELSETKDCDNYFCMKKNDFVAHDDYCEDYI